MGDGWRLGRLARRLAGAMFLASAASLLVLFVGTVVPHLVAEPPHPEDAVSVPWLMAATLLAVLTAAVVSTAMAPTPDAPHRRVHRHRPTVRRRGSLGASRRTGPARVRRPHRRVERRGRGDREIGGRSAATHQRHRPRVAHATDRAAGRARGVARRPHPSRSGDAGRPARPGHPTGADRQRSRGAVGGRVDPGCSSTFQWSTWRTSRPWHLPPDTALWRQPGSWSRRTSTPTPRSSPMPTACTRWWATSWPTPSSTAVGATGSSSGSTSIGGYGVLEVSDTGPGFRAEELPYVFERSWRGVSADGTRGSGLGLPIVRALVQAQDGTVQVHSVQGNGATFSVRLPRPT